MVLRLARDPLIRQLVRLRDGEEHGYEALEAHVYAHVRLRLGYVYGYRVLAVVGQGRAKRPAERRAVIEKFWLAVFHTERRVG